MNNKFASYTQRCQAMVKITLLSIALTVLPSTTMYTSTVSEETSSKILRDSAMKRFHLKESASYYRTLGDQFKNLKNYTQAIKNYEYSILVDKNCGLCYYSLGEIYYRQKLYQESIVNLIVSETKRFDFTYDRIRAKYLLAIDYFYQKNMGAALQTLQHIITEYKLLVDKAGFNASSTIKTEYYAPAFFLINLYNYNNKLVDTNPINMSYLQKNLELNYNNAFVNFFLYSYYKEKNILNLAFEYLTQAKIIDPLIEKKIKTLPWVKNYDIFNIMITQ